MAGGVVRVLPAGHGAGGVRRPTGIRQVGLGGILSLPHYVSPALLRDVDDWRGPYDDLKVETGLEPVPSPPPITGEFNAAGGLTVSLPAERRPEHFFGRQAEMKGADSDEDSPVAGGAAGVGAGQNSLSSSSETSSPPPSGVYPFYLSHSSASGLVGGAMSDSTTPSSGEQTPPAAAPAPDVPAPAETDSPFGFTGLAHVPVGGNNAVANVQDPSEVVLVLG